MDQAEQLRNIVKQKNQQFASNARVITVTSGKGGVGKSNVAVNIAVQIRKQGKRVIIIDADFGLANVEVMFGAIPKYNFSDLIYRGKSIRDIITVGPMEIGFISGGSGIAGINNLTRDQIAYLINCMQELDQMTDVILIDTGAGISDSVLEFVLASPETILVTTPEPSSLTDSYCLLKALYRSPRFRWDERKIKVVSNRVASAEEGTAVFGKLNAVVAQFLEGSLEYLGMLPQDCMLEKAVRQQNPVVISYPEAKVSRAFEVLAGYLLEEKEVSFQRKRGIAQLFSSLIHRRK